MNAVEGKQTRQHDLPDQVARHEQKEKRLWEERSPRSQDTESNLQINSILGTNKRKTKTEDKEEPSPTSAPDTLGAAAIDIHRPALFLTVLTTVFKKMIALCDRRARNN